MAIGPPTHSVGGRTSNGRCRRRRRRLSSSVTLHAEPGGGITRAGQAVQARPCLQSDYSSTATRRASSVTSR